MFIPKIIAIVAMDESRAIGIEGKLPWNIPEDMRRFSKLTSGNTVLMGRKTYESLPAKFRPLPNRANIIASRKGSTVNLGAGAILCEKPENFLTSLKLGREKIVGNLWIIGGAEIYRLSMPFWDVVELTRVEGRHAADAFFPEFESNFKLVAQEPGPKCVFQRYERINT
jgi:dihydrofolate reductase